MPEDGVKVYRPTRKLRLPPSSLTPARCAAYTRQRVIESFVKDFLAASPGDFDVSAMEFPHYANFAKQVWRHKNTVNDKQELKRKIELRIGHWSEVVGLKEPVLRRLADEVLKTRLATS